MIVTSRSTVCIGNCGRVGLYSRHLFALLQQLPNHPIHLAFHLARSPIATQRGHFSNVTLVAILHSISGERRMRARPALSDILSSVVWQAPATKQTAWKTRTRQWRRLSCGWCFGRIRGIEHFGTVVGREEKWRSKCQLSTENVLFLSTRWR